MNATERSAGTSRRTLPWVGSLSVASPFLDEAGEGSTSGPAVLDVLVVDDEAASRTVTARMLKEAGFQVHQAASGKEALKFLAHHSDIKLAVVDIIMPEMNGVTLAARLPELAPACRVILMTGHAPERYGLTNTITRFPLLIKPFDLAQLKAKVQEVLRIDL